MSYSPLSESEICSSSDSEEEEKDDVLRSLQNKHNSRTMNTTVVVIHMDVDYFYCQCEEQELPLEASKNRPIAIGQKHIIVTCNYVARSQGIRKLMLKAEALRKCPHLLIMDGSNLERYRRYSTNICKALREQVKKICEENGMNNTSVAMRKGGMDEVLCDISSLVDVIVNKSHVQSVPLNAFIYGDCRNDSSSIVLTDDQSGAQSVITNHVSAPHEFNLNDDDDDDTVVAVQRRLHAAAACAERIRHAIYTNTGFTTSMGVSVSPMLSKIASSLKKPNGLSILYPWHASSLIPSMPLRKVPLLGHSTLKALEPCLQQYNHDKRDNGDFWTCR